MSKVLNIFLLAGSIIFNNTGKCYIQDTLSDKELHEVFSYMIKQDQSNYKNPVIRRHIFINNFNTLITITSFQGFPKYLSEPKTRRKREYISIMSTVIFVHILQAFPEMMLNDQIIALLKKEILLGNLDRNVLKNAMSSISKFLQLDLLFYSEDIEQKYKVAAYEWGIDLNSNLE